MTREPIVPLEPAIQTTLNPLANTVRAIVHDCDVVKIQMDAIIDVLNVDVPRYSTKQHRAEVLQAVTAAVGILQGVMGVIGPVVSGDMLASKMEALLLDARKQPPIIGNGHKEN